MSCLIKPKYKKVFALIKRIARRADCVQWSSRLRNRRMPDYLEIGQFWNDSALLAFTHLFKYLYKYMLSGDYSNSIEKLSVPMKESYLVTETPNDVGFRAPNRSISMP